MSIKKMSEVNYLIQVILLLKQDCLNSPASATDQAVAQLAAYSALLAKLTEKES